MIRNDIIILIDRQSRGALSEAEDFRLAQWLQEVSIDEFTQTIQAMGDNDPRVHEVPQAFRERLEAKVDEIERLDQEEESLPSIPAHRIRFLKTTWFKYAAAILIILGLGTYLWNNYSSEPETNSAAITPSSTDILPGGQKAVLTLADGRQIVLDSAKNGQLATESGSNIIKQGDEIIYDANQIQGNEVVFNTMSTPRGGQYQLTLPDGTKVWLNAASSITYPTAFTGHHRMVTVKGEAYFEVTKNAGQPFIVKTAKQEITVLGTSFNVNAYEDEAGVKTSLLEGSVKIEGKILRPGQAYKDGKITPTNIEQDVAWKNGFFDFEGADLLTVMRQLERWYDIDVQYKGHVTKRVFGGKLPRDLKLNDILEILRQVNIKYQIQNKTLFIE